MRVLPMHRPEARQGRPARALEELFTPQVRVAVVGASKDPNAKVTVLLFPAGDPRPARVVKVPTTPRAAASVEAERRVLHRLHEVLPATVAGTIPRVLDTVEFEGLQALVAQALPGVPMTATYHRWRHTARPSAVRDDFELARRWLARFQALRTGPPAPLEMDAGVSDRLADRFRHWPPLDQAIRRLSEIHAGLRRSSTPRTAVHGDLWWGNLLVAPGRITGVVDWEAGEISGEPVRDLVRFALMYALYLDRHTRPGRPVAGHRGLRAGVWGAGSMYAIEGQGWFPTLFRRFLQDGLARLGAPEASWRQAALAGIAEVAATTDDHDFARRHLDLFRRLAVRPVGDVA